MTSQDFRHPPDSRFPSDSPIRLPFSLDPCFSWVTTFFSTVLQLPNNQPAGLQLFSQLGYRHPPDSRFPIDSPIRLPFSLDPYFSRGPQLFAQLGYNFLLSTPTTELCLPIWVIPTSELRLPPFCLIWVATWISSYTGLPSSSYYFPSELCLPIRLTGLWSRLWSLMSDSNIWIVFPPFCPIWVAIWISSFTGLPSGSYSPCLSPPAHFS